MQPDQIRLLKRAIFPRVIPVINLQADEDTGDNDQHLDYDCEPVALANGF